MKNSGRAPIEVRWLDIKVEVAQEIKQDNRQDLFAATPPLEAKKVLFSWAVAEGIVWNIDNEEGMKIDFIDVRRACFYAPAVRKVYVELPAEDDTPGYVGL